MIQVEHLTKRYGGHLAVDDISFEVEEGIVYGLLGPNGAGKSTTMNILTGYLSASSGTVSIDGHDILEEAGAAKACVGYLPEQPPLYVDMTPREYLLFVAELKKVKRAERIEQVEQAMERTGLIEMENRLIKNLSKGYRQRVGLAAALLGNPKVIILDEPTVGLDPAQVIEIRSLIKELGKDHTVILSSHILSEVSTLCDKVLIIAKGKLVAQGTPEELAQRLTAGSALNITALGEADAVMNALLTVLGVSEVQRDGAGAAGRRSACCGQCCAGGGGLPGTGADYRFHEPGGRFPAAHRTGGRRGSTGDSGGAGRGRSVPGGSGICAGCGGRHRAARRGNRAGR